MVRQLEVPFEHGDRQGRFRVFLGDHECGRHPLQYQAEWLQNHHGYRLDPSVMKRLATLARIAESDGVALEDLLM
ncbi:DUF2610 domain-containing protein [Sulfidibacter corallicola]|uniref:DUF2610 domain-containing protein n=1 Tax=Sulfidibacter corallicola TaxID=2818388 RepID=A0A8A4TR26_SULCO|nr:DUF2610 domain-containing protein [Sulfidibacter corallicola]QTD51468.1 DUF2610 domain-containing protein [Sulfidibacter corallicola]